MRWAIVRFPGANCDEDARFALEKAGIRAEFVWHTERDLRGFDGVFLPGGFGTLDELSEVLVLIQTEKVHRFPVFLLDRGYWEGLVRWLAFLRDQKAVGPEGLGLFRLLDEPEEVVQALKAEAPPR